MNKTVWLILLLCIPCVADSYTRCEKEREIELLKMNSPRYICLYQPPILRRFALGEIDLSDKYLHLLRAAQQERARGNRARFAREFGKPVTQGPKLYFLPSPFVTFGKPHPGGYESHFGRAAGKFQGGRISGADFERELDEYLRRKTAGPFGGSVDIW